jgi:L-ascorbate metabolism protein UlaG (beta-lactamase superfamily)
MGRANQHPPSSSSLSAAQDFESRQQELALAHRRHRPQRYRSLVLHWLGRWLRQPVRAMVAPLPSVTPGQVGISFAGHATVLIRYASRTIVCDPMLGKWVKGVKRAVAPGLTAADLHDVNVILISHGHGDHLHRPTLARLPKSATVVLPPRTAHKVSDLGFARVVEISPGKSLQDHGVDIATAAVRHGSEDLPALSYIIRGDGPSVYLCGDSAYSPTFAAIGKRYRPDIAILPIGGYTPLSFRQRHMSPLDALYALEDLGARIMIPIHHGAFALSYEDVHEPARWLAELVRERELEEFVIQLEPGESRVFVPPRPEHAGQPVATPESDPGTSAPPRSGMRFERAGERAGVAMSGAGAAAPVAEPAPGPVLLHPLPALRACTRIQEQARTASAHAADIPARAAAREDMDSAVEVIIDVLSEPMPALA